MTVILVLCIITYVLDLSVRRSTNHMQMTPVAKGKGDRPNLGNYNLDV